MSDITRYVPSLVHFGWMSLLVGPIMLRVPTWVDVHKLEVLYSSALKCFRPKLSITPYEVMFARQFHDIG